MNECILVVDDDPEIVRAIAILLEKEGYQVLKAYNGMEALEQAVNPALRLIVIDVMMPRLDGLSAVMKIREKRNLPIIVLSAKSEDSDKVLGLSMGADDYIVKPFSIRELLARIEAILRRTTGRRDVGIVAFKELALHTRTRQAFIADEPLALKGKQYDILEYLVSHHGSLISKERLFDKIWGFMSDTSSNVVEVYVSALRKALAPTGYDRYIKTIRGAGYLFTEDDHD